MKKPKVKRSRSKLVGAAQRRRATRKKKRTGLPATTGNRTKELYKQQLAGEQGIRSRRVALAASKPIGPRRCVGQPRGPLDPTRCTNDALPGSARCERCGGIAYFPPKAAPKEKVETLEEEE